MKAALLATFMCFVSFHNQGRIEYYNLDNLITMGDMSDAWGNRETKTRLEFGYASSHFVDESIEQVIKAIEICKKQT